MSQFLSKEKRLLLAQALASKEKRLQITRTVTRSRPTREPIERRCDTSIPEPLSFAQQRFGFLHNLDPAKGHCNIPVAFSLTGNLQTEALVQTLREVARRHESLRTLFPSRNREPVQVACETADLDLAIQDISGLPPSEREPVARAILHEQAIKAFDITSEPCARFRILRLDERVHWLLLVAHHMVFDTWSLGVFSREMAALYEAFSQGRPSLLAELEIQYADFTHWEKNASEQGRFANQLNYWKTKLQGAPELLRLPIDRPRAPFHGDRGKSMTFAWKGSITDSMMALSHKERSSVFIILLTVLTILIHRYGGGRDITIGSAVATRKLRDTEALIGCFMNTLIFRTRLSGDPTFLELLRQIRDEALESYEHSEVPLEQVVAALNPKRNPSYSPYSQVMLIVQNAEIPKLAGSGIEVARLPVSERFVSQQDLTIHVRSLDGGLRGLVDYNSDLFDATTIERFLNHFEHVLASAMSNPDLSLSQLNLSTPVENDSPTCEENEIVVPALLHRVIEQQAERAPDKIALACRDEQLSYAELNNRANQVARRLIAAGAKPEQPVAICVEEATALVIGLLGILKTGAACLPLDPSTPRTRLRAILKKAGQAPLIIESRIAKDIAPGNRFALYIDSEPLHTAARYTTNPNVALHPDNLAYIAYSSGATGRPRPVMITYGAIEKAAHFLTKTIGFQGEDVLASIPMGSSYSSIPELFIPLTKGARLTMFSKEEVPVPAPLQRGIKEAAATAMCATPMTWRGLLDSGWVSNPAYKILCAGEALPPDILAALTANGAEVWNVYGSAETTFWSTVGQCEDGKPVTIGSPLANVYARVLDESLRPTPIGVKGELYIGGTNLARGYLNRPDLTAERFVPDFLATEPGARLYRTGDVVRYSAACNLCFAYRSDHQTTTQGFRIRLGEIEAMLCLHPSISQAVVVPHRTEYDRKELIAYVVARRGWMIDEVARKLLIRELSEFLKMQLPDYLIPATITVLDNMPQSLNGKTNRKALTKFEPDCAERVSRTFQPPDSEIEKTIAGVWSRVLRVERVSVNDDFFNLGGDSLKAQRMLVQVEHDLGINIPVVAAFANPTVAQLSFHIDRSRRVI